MLSRLVAVLLILPVLASGCLEDVPLGDDGKPAVGCESPFDTDGIRKVEPTVDPLVDDRALQWDHDSYNVRTCSLPAIDREILDPDGTPHRYLGEIDMRGDLDLGAVAVVGNGETPRVYLVDITQRDDPEVLSMIDQHGTYIVDVKISTDGKILYVASQSTPGDGVLATPGEPESPSGFTAYNIEDRTSPKYLGTVVDANLGCHMLSAVQVASNQDAVFCVSQHVRSYLVQRDGDRLLNFGFVDYLPSNSAGVPTPALPVVGAAVPGFTTSGPHDMTPFYEGGAFGEGKTYMVVSHLGSGVRVIDVTEAPLVTEVGVWMGEGAKHYAGAVHSAMMFQVGDKRYIAASPEYTNPTAVQVPSVWILDATDLSDLKLVAEWYHPAEHPAQGLYQTLHQFQVAPTGPDVAPEDVRIYITYNHAGVWVLDFGKILAHDNQGAILGFNLARAPIDQDGAVANAILSTWDVNVVDGYIYGSDRATGLWTFHYQGDTLGDERIRGFA